MSRGFVFLAQNNSEHNYVEQAYLLALSIRATQTSDFKICLITNEKLSDTQHSVFDDVVEIPWADSAAESDWKIENRWKIYHATPYRKNIVLDTDMLVLQDLGPWWDFLENYKLFFTDKVYTYRGDLVTNDYYRKAFTTNNLPNLYSAFHYFEKSDYAHKFYDQLELVVNNWELFYGNFVKSNYPKRMSIDVSCAVVAKMLDIDSEITNQRVRFPSFTHMKTHVQDWEIIPERWQDRVGVYLTDELNLKIGNFTQNGIFHYVEKDFVTHDIIKKYERANNVNN